jgi:hypothetical protein
MKETTFQAALEKELKNVSENGNFSALSLSDESGLVLATIGDHELATIASAISSLSLTYKKTVQEQLKLHNIDEVSTVSNDKYRFVNRYVQVDDSYYIITLIVYPNQTYRRLTNTAISRIKKVIQGR